MKTTVLSLVLPLLTGSALAATFTPIPPEEYEIPFSSAFSCIAPYGNNEAGYGCHAVFHKSFGPNGVFADISANMCWGVDPFLDFPGPNAACLNGNEASVAVFPGGDPVGVWERHFALSPKELVVGAVMAMDRWESTVYTGLHIGGEARVVAIERVSLGLKLLGQQTLPSACAWLDYSVATNADDVDFKCALYEGSSITVQEVDVTYWDDTGMVEETLTANEFEDAFVDYLAEFEPNGHRLAKIPYLLSR